MIGILPKSLTVNNKNYLIYSDYRVALLIFDMYNNADLSKEAQAFACISLLYHDISIIPTEDYIEAFQQAMWYLDGGDIPKSAQQPKPILSWDQDESIIFPALNKVAGKEIRELDYMHWWSFLGLFNEIGEGLYTAIMQIRHKKAYGKVLDKSEQEYYARNRHLIDIKQKLTPEEEKELEFIKNLV